MQSASKAITYNDEQRPNGGVLRSYYRGSEHQCTVRIDAGAPPRQQASARDAERYYLGHTRGAEAIRAPAVEPAPEPKPKTPQRLALEKLWQSCFDRGGPTLDNADALAAEIGVKAATALILQHGSEAPMVALSEHVWLTWGGGSSES